MEDLNHISERLKRQMSLLNTFYTQRIRNFLLSEHWGMDTIESTIQKLVTTFKGSYKSKKVMKNPSKTVNYNKKCFSKLDES